MLTTSSYGYGFVFALVFFRCRHAGGTSGSSVNLGKLQQQRTTNNRAKSKNNDNGGCLSVSPPPSCSSYSSAGAAPPAPAARILAVCDKLVNRSIERIDFCVIERSTVRPISAATAACCMRHAQHHHITSSSAPHPTYTPAPSGWLVAPSLCRIRSTIALTPFPIPSTGDGPWSDGAAQIEPHTNRRAFQPGPYPRAHTSHESW